MMFRSQTNDQIVLRFDKFPWTDEHGERFDFSHDAHGALIFNPRPWLVPTQDPEPWVNMGGHRIGPKAATVLGLVLGVVRGWDFKPRPEYDHRPPVNPILVSFREDVNGGGELIAWALRYLDRLSMWTDTVGPIAVLHAMRVLRRLANLA